MKLLPMGSFHQLKLPQSVMNACEGTWQLAMIHKKTTRRPTARNEASVHLNNGVINLFSNGIGTSRETSLVFCTTSGAKMTESEELQFGVH